MLFFKNNSFRKDKKFAAGTKSIFRPRLLCSEQLENRELLDATSLDLAALIRQGYDSTSSTNTVYVTSLADSLTNNDDGLITLREALNLVNAGTEIKFSLSGTIYLAGKIVIDRSITIDASSQSTITLNGRGTCSIMEIGNRSDTANNPTTVTLKNISFYNGKTDNVGAALNINYYSDVNIDNCFFLSNTSADNGGAIYSYSYTDVLISNSVFQNNTSTGGSGGALYVNTQTNGTFFVTTSQFKNNSAGIETKDSRGGAIYLISPSSELESVCAEINDCEFLGNRSVEGGAIAFCDSVVSVKNSLFKSNSANAYGGALYQDSSIKYMSLDLIGSTFTGNTANSAGGAFYIHSGIVQAKNNSYCENAALNGGALYLYGGKTHNFLNSNYYSLADQFDSNSAFLNSKGFSGGAILSEGTLNLVNVTFTNNEAIDDGGAILNKGKLILDQAAFSNNKAMGSNGYGGAIRCSYENTSEITIDNSLFMNNYATERGGALDLSIGKTIITNTLFHANSTTTVSDKNCGGAIYANDSVTKLDFDNCCFSENKSYVASTIYDASLLSAEGNKVLNITKSDFYADNIDFEGSTDGGIHSKNGYVLNGLGMLASYTTKLESQYIYSDDFVLKDLYGQVIDGTIFFNPTTTSSDSGKVLYQATFTLSYTGSTSIVLQDLETRIQGSTVKITGLTKGETINPGESRQITISISSTNQASVNMERQNWRLSDGKYLRIAAGEISIMTGNTLLISETKSFADSPSNSLKSSYTVQLRQQPTQNVTVYLRASNGVKLSVDKLVFSKENWNVAQTVDFTLDVTILAPQNISSITISHFWSETDASYENIDVAAAVSDLVVDVPDYVVLNTHQDDSGIPEDVIPIIIGDIPTPVVTQKDYPISQGKLSIVSVQLRNLFESLRFEWGDGMIQNININNTFSTRQTHYYDVAGDYQVTLTIYYRDIWDTLQSATFILPVQKSATKASAAVESLSITEISSSIKNISASETIYENIVIPQNALETALLLLENEEEENNKNALLAITASDANYQNDLADSLRQAREIVLNELSLTHLEIPF